MLTARSRIRRAFTLVEMIVVIVVIALLLGLAAFGYQQFIAGSKRTALTGTAHQVGKAVQAYSALHDIPYSAAQFDQAVLTQALDDDGDGTVDLPAGVSATGLAEDPDTGASLVTVARTETAEAVTVAFVAGQIGTGFTVTTGGTAPAPPDPAPAHAYATTVLAQGPAAYYRFGDAAAPVTVVGSAQSSAYNGSYTAAAALDTEPRSAWAISAGPTGWMSLELSTPTPVPEYQIMPRTPLTEAPRDWTFEGSVDGTTWTVLDTRTGISWPTREVQTFTPGTSGLYRHYRLNVTAMNGGARVSLAELTSPAWTTTLRDSTTHGRDGALARASLGVPSLVGDASDTAAQFTPPATALVPYGPWMDGPFTVSAVLTTTATGYRDIAVRDFGNGSGSANRLWEFRLNSGRVEFAKINAGTGYNTTAPAGTEVNDGLPHHVAASYDGTEVVVYVDGVEVARSTRPGSMSADLPLYLGSGQNSSFFFDGVLDEVALFPRALDPAEVAAQADARS